MRLTKKELSAVHSEIKALLVKGHALSLECDARRDEHRTNRAGVISPLHEASFEAWMESSRKLGGNIGDLKVLFKHKLRYDDHNVYNYVNIIHESFHAIYDMFGESVTMDEWIADQVWIIRGKVHSQ
jgi:hypothetical protein